MRMRMLAECSVGGINSTDPQMAISFEDRNAGCSSSAILQACVDHLRLQVRETPRVTLDLPDSSSHLHYPQIVFRTFTTTQGLPSSSGLPLCRILRNLFAISLGRVDHLRLKFQDK